METRLWTTIWQRAGIGGLHRNAPAQRRRSPGPEMHQSLVRCRRLRVPMSSTPNADEPRGAPPVCLPRGRPPRFGSADGLTRLVTIASLCSGRAPLRHFR